MGDFIGREKELALLQTAYQGEGSAFIPIYGRRRVGKSELLLRFLKGKQAIYYLGKQAPAHVQIGEFLEESAAALDEPLLAGYAADTWRAALDAVVSRCPGRKLIIAFDEFQWIVSASPELPSILQEKWDREWKQSGKILLILCGSYIGFMEKKILGRKSPLFGRRTAQMLLQPFSYHEAALFHPNYSLTDRARAYFICGGIPLYLRFFSDRRSIEANIIAELLHEYAPLYREGEFLLREELREVESYYAILLAVAAGNYSNQNIAKYAGMDVRGLHYYLQQLLGLGYLERCHPLAEGSRVARHVRYELADPLLRFWFRFVFPNASYILHMGPERALADRIRPHLDSYFGTCFEKLCREALPWIYKREGVSASFTVGEFWSKSVQIDVVGFRDDSWTDLGECKWGAVRSAGRVQKELEEKVGSYPNSRNATVGRRIFVRQKPKAVSPKGSYSWHDLEDLYEV
jgi:AAA+ ATPase superfamily predicted ATPase